MEASSAYSTPPRPSILRPKSGRIPLRPKNSQAYSSVERSRSRSKPECFNLSLSTPSDKENHRPLDAASLAEELDLFKKKLERLRLDGEATENLLRERDLVLEFQMKELIQRDHVQKELEIEVDRLFRLKELRSCSMKVSPVRTLREKERDKLMNGAAEQWVDMETDDDGESVPETPWLLD